MIFCETEWRGVSHFAAVARGREEGAGLLSDDRLSGEPTCPEISDFLSLVSSCGTALRLPLRFDALEFNPTPAAALDNGLGLGFGVVVSLRGVSWIL
jgi:hypothetical protein